MTNTIGFSKPQIQQLHQSKTQQIRMVYNCKYGIFRCGWGMQKQNLYQLKQILILITKSKSKSSMGCTQSSAVENTNKTKPVFAINQQPATESNNQNILMGEVQENKYVCYNVVLPLNDDAVVEIAPRKVPELMTDQKQQAFKVPNFAQLTQIGSSTMYLLTGGINFKLDDIYSSVYLFNSKQNKVQRMTNLTQARYTHSATYADGYVYVMGGRFFGEDHQALLNKCERLLIRGQSDQQIADNLKQKAKWENVAPMNIARCSQVTVNYNNKIYTMGGYTAECQRSPIIEYFDAKAKGAQWIVLDVHLPFGIQSCVAFANNDNQVTIFGGNTNWGPVDIVLTVNLLQGCESIHSNSKMQERKILHKGYLWQTHKKETSILMLGGSEKLNTQAYKFDNQPGEQRKKKTVQKNILLKHFKSQSSFQALTHSSSPIYIPYNAKIAAQSYERSDDDQIVYVFGTSTQPFILQLNISVPYTLCLPMPLSIKLYALQGAIYLKKSNQYLLFGGITDSQEEVSNQSYIYSPNDSFKKSGLVANMITPRYAFGYDIIDDWVYAIGGGSSDEQGELIILSQCERINIKNLSKAGSKQTSKWEPIADLPYALISSMTLNYKNNLYVFGGMKSNKQRYQNILKYTQKQNKWEQLKFSFQFGLQASSIYHQSQSQYLIFGGRVVNGDTKNIWGLTMINNGEDCVFEQKGQMKEAKCLHHAYKPRHQDFIVVLGGEKDVLSYYDCKSLKPIQSDVLAGMKELFVSSLNSLSDKSLKNYTVAMKL